MTTFSIPLATAHGLDEPMIRAVVERFYAQARQDSLLGPVFRSAVSDEQWQPHLDTIVNFWSAMFLGTRRYDGRPLQKHLLLPELRDEHFRRWLTLFRQTVENVCPADVAALWIDRSERIGNSFRIGVRMHHGSDVTRLQPLKRDVGP